MASNLADIATVDSSGTTSLRFTAGGTEAARIVATGGGRLGVLQTSPALRLHVGGSGTLGLPSGDAGQRPATPSAGMMRWNTTVGAVEGFDGTLWRSLGPSYGTAGIVVVDQSLNVGSPSFVVNLPVPGGVGRVTITGVNVSAFNWIAFRFRIDGTWRNGRTVSHFTTAAGGWRNSIYDPHASRFEITSREMGPNWPGSVDMYFCFGFAWGSATVWNWPDSEVDPIHFAGWYDYSGASPPDAIEILTTDGSNLDSGWITVVQWGG